MPKLKETPTSFSFQFVNVSSGSDHNKSQRRPIQILDIEDHFPFIFTHHDREHLLVVEYLVFDWDSLIPVIILKKSCHSRFMLFLNGYRKPITSMTTKYFPIHNRYDWKMIETLNMIESSSQPISWISFTHTHQWNFSIVELSSAFYLRRIGKVQYVFYVG